MILEAKPTTLKESRLKQSVTWHSTSKRSNIRIALQKSGRLKDSSVELLRSWGVTFPQTTNERALIVCCPGDIEIIYVRHSDIPRYVYSGAADYGIVGENVLYEHEVNVAVRRKLGFGACELIVAVPENSLINSTKDLDGERIATSYPNSLRRTLREENVDAEIVEIGGAVEAAPALGLADAICDLRQTGSTLKANRLRQLAVVWRSEAVFIESPYVSAPKTKFFETFLQERL